MIVPAQFRECYRCLEKNNRMTLKDAQTKLYIKAKETIWIITVDRGIIPNVKQAVRKCDYLVYGEIKETTHLIELKGSVIDEAYKQLNETIKNMINHKDLSYLIEGREIVDAYIISPNTQRIPGINSHERELAKRLASKCKSKPIDIINLIKYEHL